MYVKKFSFAIKSIFQFPIIYQKYKNEHFKQHKVMII